MPLQQCTIDGESGWRFGESGTCYVGADAKEKAIAQGIAMGEIDATKGALAIDAIKSQRAYQALREIVGDDGSLPVRAVKFNESRQEATGVLAKPFDGTSASLDFDGEAMLPKDVFTLIRSYMLLGRTHGHDDEHDMLPHDRILVEAFFNDDRIQSPHFPPNSGVVTLHYPDPDDWQLVLSGKRSGFSFDAKTKPVIMEVELIVPDSKVVTG